MLLFTRMRVVLPAMIVRFCLCAGFESHQHEGTFDIQHADPALLQYLWAVHGLSTLESQSVNSLSASVAIDLMRLTRLSANSHLADCYGRPGAVALSSIGGVAKTELSSGFSRDLVQLKERWENLSSRGVLSVMNRARRALIGRLLLYGPGLADQLISNSLGHSNTATNASVAFISEPGGQRSLHAAIAIARASSAYLIAVERIVHAAAEAVEGAEILQRRLNIAVGICLQDTRIHHEREHLDPEQVQPLDPHSTRVAPQLHHKEGTDFNPEGQEGLGGDWVKRRVVDPDYEEGTQAADRIVRAFAGIATAASPRGQMWIACALGGVSAAWMPDEGQQAMQALCGCGEDTEASICTDVVNKSADWADDMVAAGSPRGPQQSRSTGAWDCCKPASRQGGSASWGSHTLHVSSEALAECNVVGSSACERHSEALGDGNSFVDALQSSTTKRASHSNARGGLNVAGALFRALRLLKAVYQNEDARAVAGIRS